MLLVWKLRTPQKGRRYIRASIVPYVFPILFSIILPKPHIYRNRPFKTRGRGEDLKMWTLWKRLQHFKMLCLMQKLRAHILCMESLQADKQLRLDSNHDYRRWLFLLKFLYEFNQEIFKINSVNRSLICE